MSAPFAAAFPFPHIFMQDVAIVSFPGNVPLAPPDGAIKMNLQPATLAGGSLRTTMLPAEYYGPTYYHGYTDDLGPIPPKGPWHTYRFLKDGMYYKIVLIKGFANHYMVILDEVRNG